MSEDMQPLPRDSEPPALRHAPLSLDAPTYPPASNFKAPERLPYRLTANGTSLKVLMDHSDAWKIVTEEVPSAAVFIQMPAAQPFLANFTLRSLAEFGATTQEAIERVEARLLPLEMVR